MFSFTYRVSNFPFQISKLCVQVSNSELTPITFQTTILPQLLPSSTSNHTTHAQTTGTSRQSEDRPDTGSNCDYPQRKKQSAILAPHTGTVIRGPSRERDLRLVDRGTFHQYLIEIFIEPRDENGRGTTRSIVVAVSISRQINSETRHGWSFSGCIHRDFSTV